MGMLDKIIQKLGFDDDETEIGETQPIKKEDNKIQPIVPTNNRSPKVVPIHQNQQFKMVVLQPSNLEDAKEICDYLKDKKPVVVNIDLEGMQLEMPQRILDFLSGCVYALDGSIETVTKGIYVVVPSNVDISNHIK